MISIGAVEVFNAEVVDGEGEGRGLGLVAPESGGVGYRIVAVGLEVSH